MCLTHHTFSSKGGNGGLGFAEDAIALATGVAAVDLQLHPLNARRCAALAKDIEMKCKLPSRLTLRESNRAWSGSFSAGRKFRSTWGDPSSAARAQMALTNARHIFDNAPLHAQSARHTASLATETFGQTAELCACMWLPVSCRRSAQNAGPWWNEARFEADKLFRSHRLIPSRPSCSDLVDISLKDLGLNFVRISSGARVIQRVSRQSHSRAYQELC